MITKLLTELTIIEPATETKKEPALKADPESQVVIHCLYKNYWPNGCVRIWKSTFLFDKDSTHVSKLVASKNITVYPEWTPLEAGEELKFTLIFSGLPRSCKSFDLVEKIPQPSGFFFPNITRNKTDVYHIELNYHFLQRQPAFPDVFHKPLWAVISFLKSPRHVLA